MKVPQRNHGTLARIAGFVLRLIAGRRKNILKKGVELGVDVIHKAGGVVGALFQERKGFFHGVVSEGFFGRCGDASEDGEAGDSPGDDDNNVEPLGHGNNGNGNGKCDFSRDGREDGVQVLVLPRREGFPLVQMLEAVLGAESACLQELGLV